MKEDFLHYLWKYKKFDFLRAKTTNGEEIELQSSGMHNQVQSGPDFFNAKIKIGKELWAGNVEIHLKSSDWYVHQHETDPAYDNVILHVVWEHDVEVYRKDNTSIPTLVLKSIIHKNALKNYQQLLGVKNFRWINCEADFPDFADFELDNWLERMYIERLESKSVLIKQILNETTYDWEATLFCVLAKNFGLNVNGDAFLSIARSIPFKVIRKIQEVEQLEALFFGQAGLLDIPKESSYHKSLKQDYIYIKHKYKLRREGILPLQFFRLRPQNFPTIRLAQLAQLYSRQKNLFYDLVECDEVRAIKIFFQLKASDFWDTHYNFEKDTSSRKKKLSNTFIDLILINTIVPLKFCYLKAKGEVGFERLFKLMRQLPVEKNNITKGFNRLREETATNALESQALIHLKKQYCDKNLCLRCHLGLKLLQK